MAQAQLRIFGHFPRELGCGADRPDRGPYQPIQGLRIDCASVSLRRRRADGFSRASIEVIVILERMIKPGALHLYDIKRANFQHPEDDASQCCGEKDRCSITSAVDCSSAELHNS